MSLDRLWLGFRLRLLARSTNLVLGCLHTLVRCGIWGWQAAARYPRTGRHQDFAEALDFSWRNAARPFSALSDDVGRDNEVILAILSSGDWSAFAARVVGTIESLLSIALLFLFALAVRSRFQMN